MTSLLYVQCVKCDMTGHRDHWPGLLLTCLSSHMCGLRVAEQCGERGLEGKKRELRGSVLKAEKPERKVQLCAAK